VYEVLTDVNFQEFHSNEQR